MNGYRDLDIYYLAKKLAIDVHLYSLKLPKYELYETGSQIRRATKSILFNIVEGYGRRRYVNEFIRFLIFSQASCDEVAAQLELLLTLYPGVESPDNIIEECDKLGRKINKFIQGVEANRIKF